MLMETTNKSGPSNSTHWAFTELAKRADSDEPRSAENLASEVTHKRESLAIWGKTSATNRHLSDAATPQPQREPTRGAGMRESVRRLIALPLAL